jgi:hypothetical protein
MLSVVAALLISLSPVTDVEFNRIQEQWVKATLPSCSIQHRSVTQNLGGWLIEYRIRNDGPPIVVRKSNEVRISTGGWLSNSRVPSHSSPKRSKLDIVAVMNAVQWAGRYDVIPSTDIDRCRETGTFKLWKGEKPVVFNPNGPMLSLATGDSLRVRIEIDHDHLLFNYDMLLGSRTVEMFIGPNRVLNDTVTMDREPYLAFPKYVLPKIADDRLDNRHYTSPPHSLHLEAHIPGNEHFRFSEQPVRHSSKMRIRFRYLIATGTQGDCRVRIIQSRETSSAYRVLYECIVEKSLKTAGRWNKADFVLTTDEQANLLALDFRITDPEDTRIGEMWIDDVKLEYVADSPHDGP